MEQRPNIWKVGLNNGLIVGILLVIFSFILYMTDLHTHRLISNLSYLILIVGIVWAHHNYKSSGDSFMTYGQGLGLGTVVSGVAGLLNGVFIMIYIKFFDPNLLARTFEEQIVALQDQGMSQNQIDQAQTIMSFMQSPIILLIGSFIGYLFFGFILSLIISAFTKKTDTSQYN